MDYCNSFNGMAYHHSQQHNHEFRYKNGLMKVGYNNNYNNNNFYGHNQHINWNGMNHHAHHQYGGNRNVSAASCHYDSYKGNMVQNCFQTSSYASNYETPYESTATSVPTTPIYRSRYGSVGGGSSSGGSGSGIGGNGYQMCDTQQCFPNGDNNRGEFITVNESMSRCIGPVPDHIPASDPRCHQSSFIHDSGAHHPHTHSHPHSHMRMPLNHRPYDPHQKRQFDTGHQSWYGNQQLQQPHPHPHPHPNPHSHSHQHHGSETINGTNHHYYQYPTISSNSNYEYPQHINTNGNQYAAGAPNGQLIPAKEDRPTKMHRDRSLSKLVAMNRRLETQMNESERIEPIQNEHFENFDYYTDFSETPDSIASSSRYTNNDCMINTGDTDNNNNINGALNNSPKNNCKETTTVTNESEWLTTSKTSTSSNTSSTTTTQPTTRSSSPIERITTDTETTRTTTQPEQRNELQADALKIPSDALKNQTDASNNEPSVADDDGENIMKKCDLPTATTNVKSPAKQNTNKKPIKTKKANSMTSGNVPVKRRKRREKKSTADFSQIRDFKADTIPLPGFQQAFGSTEIGRFSEIFFNISGSPIEIGLFEGETDTLSPQPWEMGDSLEGPHFTPLSYTESLGSTDSNSYFSDLRAAEF